MNTELALPSTTFDLRGASRPTQLGMPDQNWLNRVELVLLSSIAAYFGLALALLTSTL